MKRVLFFGIFDPDYARSRILREGFEASGYEVVLCRVDPRTHRGVRKYVALWQQGKAFQYESFDHVLVLFPGHTVVWLARLLFGKHIIFDAFVSLFDSNVHDRHRYGARSIRAWRDRFLDRTSCALAETVLVDTQAHKQYFVEHVGVPETKVLVVPVGASRAWFDAAVPLPGDHTPVIVGFYGSYIPLHGVETIVRAAALLAHEPVHFELIGDGQEYGHVQEVVRELGVANITFVPRVSREALIEEMGSADICLGIFGDTEKAQRVVPNKVYECAALGKPIITADTPGVRETFGEEELVLVPSGSPEALADAIRGLAADPALRQRIGAAAHARMLERYTPGRIVQNLVAQL